MDSGGHVLVLDDDADTCDLLAAALREHGFTVETETRAENALVAVERQIFDAVVTDLQLDVMDGVAFCERVRATEPDLPVIFVTGRAVLESAVAALRAGAYDFITKPVDTALLRASLARAIERRRLRAEVLRLRQEVTNARGFDRLVGKSAVMQRVCDLISRVAATDATLLIGGESGTGKELVAHAVHENSVRRQGPFVAINCAAVPSNLLESELFGHARGAFTDAKSARQGLFLEADGGTLFLDEIGEMPLEMQAKLLRALQERVVRPVGGSAERPFDARVITATNRDLETLVHEGKFREDLYYRINVVAIDVPPLRDRSGDILLLAQHFVQRFSERYGKNVLGLAPAAAEKLLSYEWPGNVRELENSIERALTLTRFDQLTVDDLPEKIRAYRKETNFFMPASADELVTVNELERRYVDHVLKLVRGNKSRAAKLLGYDRRTLYRKLERLEQEMAQQRARKEALDSPIAAATSPQAAASASSNTSADEASAPITETRTRPRAMTPPRVAKVTGTRVLVVEDDQDSRDLLVTLLQAEGYIVERASCLADVLGKVKVDVAITGIRLPDGPGDRLIETLGSVPVIAMSASSEPMRGSRFAAWVTKPVSVSRLREEIQRVTNKPIARNVTVGP
ncbi:MAG: sigma 54-interacting transcriptional regulator [Sandaracinaceae bacterium]|nr:sigma 54-interacting transcriptional regulator [Sandaracinaceae bacterium]